MIVFEHVKDIDVGTNYAIRELGGGKLYHPQLRYLKQRAMVAHFDGVDAALDFISKNMSKAQQVRASEDYNQGFNLFRTYNEALDIFRNKPESVVNFDQAELHIKDANESGTEVDYDVVGDFIDMGRYMEGIPESVGTMKNGSSRNRRVNIFFQLNQGSHVSGEDITHRGERIVRLVDALEHGGVRTMVTAIDSSECGHTEIVLKHHADTLTIPDIAVVTHSEFKRRIIFRLNEYSKTWEYGYGSPKDLRDSVTAEMLQGDLNDEINIFIDGGFEQHSRRGRDDHHIDTVFDKVERLLVWELSKPVPEVSAVKVGFDGSIYFEANGARSEAEIKREGLEAMVNG